MTPQEVQQLIETTPWLGAVVALVAVWSIVWKGVGMWVAARNGRKLWFVIFLLVHTLGILEIIYLSAQRRSRSAVATGP